MLLLKQQSVTPACFNTSIVPKGAFKLGPNFFIGVSLLVTAHSRLIIALSELF